MSTGAHGSPINVLIVSYFFPPMGGVGVQRIVKLAKYLPSFDVNPLIVTGPEPQMSDHWYDTTFFDDLRSPVAVYRVGGCDSVIASRSSKAERFRRMVGLQTWFSRWWVEEGIAAALRLCSRTRIDCIMVTMSPFESARIGYEVSNVTQIPWVADLRDPWALDEMMTYPTHLHRMVERYRMRRFLRTASHIVMNTREAARVAERALDAKAGAKVCTITNGYDPDDFQKAAPMPKDAPFMIVYTGRFHTELGRKIRRRPLYYRGLGKIAGGVNVLARSHYYLLKALQLLGLDSPAIMPELRFVVAGSLSTVDKELIAQHGLADRVICKGNLDHLQTIGLLKAADLLFLPLHTVAAGKRATIVPGKTYEYLASGKPILAALPEGDARDICVRSGRAFVCNPDDPFSLARNIEHAYCAWRGGGIPASPMGNGVAHFERKKLAAQMAAVLHNAAAGHTLSPRVSSPWSR